MTTRSRFQRRSVRVVAAVAALGLFTAACGEDDAGSDNGRTDQGAAPEAPSEYLIGAILEKTGPAAPVGAIFERAQQVYFEMNPEIDGVPVRVITCDDGSTPDKAAACARKLTQQDKVHLVLGPHIAGPHRGAFPILAASDVVALTGSPYAETKPGAPVFTAGNRSQAVHDVSFAYAGKQGWKKVGILATTDITGEAGVRESEAPAKAAGVETQVERMDPTDTDATAQLAALKKGNPDAIALWMSGAAVGVSFKALKQLGMEDVPVFLIWSSLTEGFMKAVAPVLPKNTLVAAGAAALPENRKDPEKAAQLEEFSKAYQAKFGSEPDFVSLAAHDGAKLAAEVLAEGKGDTDAAVEWLEGLQGHELGVWNVSYSEDDHSGGTGEEGSYVMYKIAPGGALSPAE